MADLDEVANLLHVHEKASAHGDLLKNIANTAMAKLRLINEEHGRPTAPVQSDVEDNLLAGHESVSEEKDDSDGQ